MICMLQFWNKSVSLENNFAIKLDILAFLNLNHFTFLLFCFFYA